MRFESKTARLWLHFWILLAGLSLGTVAQEQKARQQPSVAPQGQDAQATTAETKISPEEAKELFRSVDELLAFASKDTGLPIKHSVKRKMTSRDEVETFLKKHMATDKDAKRLRRSELVLKKFGLLPREFDLPTFLVAMLKEQVAAYFDPKTQFVNLVDWVDVDQQQPVLAHELTHALQDQSFGLEKWMKAGDTDLNDNKGPTPADIANDEISTARTSVVEGQATVVMIDYMLVPTGQTLLNSREIVAGMEKAMLAGTPDSVVFDKAPMYLKEALTFPYRYGLEFEIAVLAAGGKEKAFAGVFKDPPTSSRQIMEPETYLSHEKIAPMPLPDFPKIFKGYERFDIGAMGEFDVAALVKQFAGEDASRSLYPDWRGGYYYAVHPKGDPAKPLGLLYASRWADGESAASFAAIYAKSLKQRYKNVEFVPGEGQTVLKLDTLVSLNGKHSWHTDDGMMLIEVRGNTVMAAESLDQATTDLAETGVFGAH